MDVDSCGRTTGVNRLGGLAINYVKSVRVTATSSATCYLWPVSLSGNKWHNIPAGNRFASWQNCELWTKAERVMASRQGGSCSCYSSPFGDIILSHHSLPLSLTDSPSLSNSAHMTTSWPHLQFVVLAFLWPHFARRARETACKCALIKICYVVPSPAPLPPSYRNLCLSVESQFGFYARCALKVSENFL